MTFDDLIAGDQIFVDANVLTYHAEPHPILGPPCTQLLQRIENQELIGFTSTHMLGEMAHRLMTIEAMRTYGWAAPAIAKRLRQHHTNIAKLSHFRTAVDEMLHGRIRVLSIMPHLLADAAALSQSVGLLSNDALIVAVMHANGLSKLASSDTDFDRVAGLARYAPA